MRISGKLVILSEKNIVKKLKASWFFDISFCFYMIMYTVHSQELQFALARNLSTLLLGVAAIIFWMFNPARRHRIINTYSIWYGVFVIIGLSSALWASSLQHVFEPAMSMVRILLVTNFAIIRYATKDDLIRMLEILIAVAVYLCIYILVNTPTYIIGYSRLGYFLDLNPNTISMTTAYAALFCLYLLLSQHSKKIFYIGLLAVFTFVTLISGSKKGLLILIMGFFLIVFFKSKNYKRLLVICLSGLGVFGMYYMIMSIPELYNVIGSRIESMMLYFTQTNFADESTMERFRLIREGFRIFSDNPILGVGLNNFSYFQVNSNYAHNNYVEILADLGIVGVLTYYWMPTKLLIKALNQSSKNDTLMSLSKSLIIIILIIGIGLVDYNNIRYQMIICFIYLSSRNPKNNTEIDNELGENINEIH